ncbi:unnamed protein product [Durusdinium trenchii]|uniref:C3H1-type domain-containing protein n=1 Tax=Durusdinium trenchii TaxID=1381693 RepID=A0ABP0LI11_9DINO
MFSLGDLQLHGRTQREERPGVPSYDLLIQEGMRQQNLQLTTVAPPWMSHDEITQPRAIHGYNDGPVGQDLNLANVTEPGMQDPKDPGLNKAIFRKQFKKTQMCRFFQRSSCRKGEYCEFAHGPEELAQPPDLRRTSLCKAFMEGCCPESAATCRFAHGIAMLRRTPGFDKRMAAKNTEAEVMSAAHGLEATSSEEAQQLHNILRQQQREQEEMRQVIEEQRRKINELKLQQERLQQAQLASLQPFQPQFQQPNFEAQAPEQPSGIIFGQHTGLPLGGPLNERSPEGHQAFRQNQAGNVQLPFEVIPL